MRIHAILSAVVGLVVVAGGLVAPATAAERIEQEYFWKWSDGSHASSRTFTETRYRSQRGLPNLVVTAVPAQPRHDVYLQFRQGGRWVLENRIRLDGSGTARVEINPYCENDAWCNGTFQYRVKVADSYANLTVTYAGR